MWSVTTPQGRQAPAFKADSSSSLVLPNICPRAKFLWPFVYFLTNLRKSVPAILCSGHKLAVQLVVFCYSPSLVVSLNVLFMIVLYFFPWSNSHAVKYPWLSSLRSWPSWPQKEAPLVCCYYFQKFLTKPAESPCFLGLTLWKKQ